MYYTTDNTLILRVRSKGSKPEGTCEEYITLEEGGLIIVAKQCGLNYVDGRRAEQFLVGHPNPKAKH